jgi:hypothetical protein
MPESKKARNDRRRRAETIRNALEPGSEGLPDIDRAGATWREIQLLLERIRKDKKQLSELPKDPRETFSEEYNTLLEIYGTKRLLKHLLELYRKINKVHPRHDALSQLEMVIRTPAYDELYMVLHDADPAVVAFWPDPIFLKHKGR